MSDEMTLDEFKEGEECPCTNTGVPASEVDCPVHGTDADEVTDLFRETYLLARIGKAVVERVDDRGQMPPIDARGCPACGVELPPKYHTDDCSLARYLEARDE